MKQFWKIRRIRKSIIVLVVLLIVVRAFMPLVVKNYVNRVLARGDGYTGHVNDVDLNLIRGAYEIEGVHILKTDSKIPVPFFTAERIDLSIYWRQIFKGALVGEVEVVEPQVNFVDGKGAAQSQNGEGKSWTKTVRELFPIRIDRFTVRNGRIRFRNFDSKPAIDLAILDLQATAENLTNSEKISKTLAATIRAHAHGTKTGRIELDLKLDPYASMPTFDLNSKFSDIRLPELNPFLKEYASLDVVSGSLDIVAEVFAKKGALKGYVKPLFRNLDILSWKQDVKKQKDNLLEIFWEGIVGGVGEILENQPKDQFATKIPIKGRVDDPKTDVLTVLAGVLKNAFVRALIPRYDNTVGERR
jgi:uncharacterized protein YhdP